MSDQRPTDDHVAQENRQLVGSVAALRVALEDASAREQQHVQETVAQATGEISQLKATIAALREQLEKARFGVEDGVRLAVAEQTAENRQLTQYRAFAKSWKAFASAKRTASNAQSLRLPRRTGNWRRP